MENIQINRPSVSGKSRVLKIPGGKIKNKLKIATWNVRSLYGSCKLDNTISEMKRLHISILGISETWWPESGRIVDDETIFYYSGNSTKEHRRGVGVLINKKLKNSIIDFIPKSDRTLLLKVHAKPISVNILQVYAPNADCEEDDIEIFYSEIRELLVLPKPHELTFIMGDFNAKVGAQAVENITGAYRLGTRNDKGNKLIQFCQEESFRITNTWFKLPKRRWYTWKSPRDGHGRIVRNQIDYILVNKRFASFIMKALTYPGADVPSS